MKKLISFICVLAIAAVTLLGAVTVHAGMYEEECDTVFLSALERLLVDEDITQQTIAINKEPLYDLALQQMGYFYYINIYNHEGFAIVVNTDGTFNLAEIYLNAQNPYEGYTGQRIYVCLFMYLVYQNGAYIKPDTGDVLDDTIIAALDSQALYAEDSNYYTQSETIYYTNKTESSYNLAVLYPEYVSAGLTNSCVPASAASILGYYTRYFPQLIPGFTPGYLLSGYYLYYASPTEIQPVINTLYNYMNTNIGGRIGTTIADFKTGMHRYVNEKGRVMILNSCMQGSNFNMTVAKQRLESGQPLILFLDTLTVATISSSTSDSINYLVINACHAIAGFGYREITYTLTNGQTRIDKYIAVSTGLSQKTKGYFNISYQTQIDDVYAVNIY